MNSIESRQKKICERFGSIFAPPQPTQKVGIALSTLDLIPLNAVRVPPEDDICGWYIWGGDYNEAEEFYQPMHMSHISQYCPAIEPYLALSPGWGVIISPSEDYEDVWFDEARLHV